MRHAETVTFGGSGFDRAAEKRGEKADENRPPQAGDRPGAGRFAERERQRQRDNAGGHAAEQVAA